MRLRYVFTIGNSITGNTLHQNCQFCSKLRWLVEKINFVPINLSSDYNADANQVSFWIDLCFYFLKNNWIILYKTMHIFTFCRQKTKRWLFKWVISGIFNSPEAIAALNEDIVGFLNSLSPSMIFCHPWFFQFKWLLLLFS